MSKLRLTAVAAGVAWALATASPVRAQAASGVASPLQAGIALYAAASYEEALTAFEAAGATDLAADDRVVLDRHRMLCLLALGRPAAADEAAASLLETRPDFVLTASEASPRVRAMFDDARRRILPAVVRRIYTGARRAYDDGDHARARDGFARLGGMLADPQVAAADPAFADLRTLTDGFLQLSAAAIDRASARRDYETVQAALAVLEPNAAFATVVAPLAATMSAPLAATMTAPAYAITAAAPPPAPGEDAPVGAASAPAPAPAATGAGPATVPPPFAPLGIFTYDWRDAGVVPPVAVAQPVSGWWGSIGQPAPGTPLGAIDVVVDEQGRVVDARIHQSVNRVYDTVLLESVRQWRYRPAMKDGRPVKYRRITSLVSER